jgi:hypothetical protein
MLMAGSRMEGGASRRADVASKGQRGWPPAISVLTRLAACESVSAKAKRKTDIV